MSSVLSHENRIALGGACLIQEQHLMKKARSIFNFDTARVGFRTSCLRK